MGDFGEMSVTMSNSVLQKYLSGENLLHLLTEGQNVEEHLLTVGKYHIGMQNEVLIALEKVMEAATSQEEELTAVAVLEEIVVDLGAI